MRRIPLLFLILLFSIRVSAQSDRKVDDSGDFIYQYNRTCAQNPSNPSEIIVSFVFINGKNQMAISYRQEHIGSPIRWISTEGGHQKNEELVDAITANLAPSDSVVWSFAIEKGMKDKTGVTIETAALLLMDESREVVKLLFDEYKFKP